MSLRPQILAVEPVGVVWVRDEVMDTKACKTLRAWEIRGEDLCRSVGSCILRTRGKPMLQLRTFGKDMLPRPAGRGMRVLQMKRRPACLAANLCFQNGKTLGEVTKEEGTLPANSSLIQRGETNLSTGEVA